MVTVSQTQPAARANAAQALESDPRNRVVLRVDGRDFGGWQSIDIARGLEQGASTFAFASVTTDPETDERYDLEPDMRCEVLIGGQVVIRGAIDMVDPRIDPDSRGLAVSGRSVTRALVDCSAVHGTGSWRRRTAQQILAELAATYGLTVAVEPSIDRVETLFALEHGGESVYEVAERLARTRGAVLYDDAEGVLHMAQCALTRSTTSLVCPGNVIAANLARDGSQRHGEYRCKGLSVTDDGGWSETDETASGTVRDPTQDPTRILILASEGAATRQQCADRALTEALIRAGRSVRGSVTVRGWRQDSGALWAPNLVVACDIPDVRAVGLYLVTGCALSLGDDGPRASLSIGLPGAYRRQLPKARKGKAKAGAGTWGEIDFDLGDE